MAENRTKIESAIAPMIRAFQRSAHVSRRLKPGKHHESAAVSLRSRNATVAADRQYARPLNRSGAAIIAIGISTGGPNALAKMLPMIPGDIGVPILIVQHMPPMFTRSLANSLAAKCAIAVREATQGEPIMPNTALIAPGGKQMKIVAGADGKSRIIKITDDPPENSCKPSVDYLFRSVAHHFVGRATGVIMTGMGSDGTQGLKLMKKNGATVIAQDEATCVVFGMPKAAVETGIADAVLPLDQIAETMVKTVRMG